jgi:hypothetical protein
MYIFGGDCLTINNTIAYNGTSGISFANNFTAQLEQIRIYMPGIYVNNIIACNGDYGVNFDEMIPYKIGDTEISELPFVANDVWGNEEGNYHPGAADVTGMLGNISSDPMFVSSSDMHLLAVSPCVDVGADIFTFFLQKDLDGTTRPRGEGFDMGCYELDGNSFSPVTFQPLVTTQLANANATWTCIMDNLPDDPELMEEVEPMLEEVQAHMGNATSIANYVQANGELRQAFAIMAEIDAMCECGCTG